MTKIFSLLLTIALILSPLHVLDVTMSYWFVYFLCLLRTRQIKMRFLIFLVHTFFSFICTLMAKSESNTKLEFLLKWSFAHSRPGEVDYDYLWELRMGSVLLLLIPISPNPSPEYIYTLYSPTNHCEVKFSCYFYFIEIFRCSCFLPNVMLTWLISNFIWLIFDFTSSP